VRAGKNAVDQTALTTKRQSLRREIYRILESPRGGGWIRRWIDAGLILLILINAALIVIEEVMPPGAYAVELRVVEWVTVAVFAVEYGFRLWVAAERDDRHHLSPWRLRLGYILSPVGLIDLCAFAPSLLSGLIFLDPRYLRLVRLLKLVRYSPALQSLAAVFYKERRTLFGALLIAVIALFVSAGVVHLAEREAQPEAFGTITESMWWAIVTVARIGYGDVVPHTPLGKLIGGVSALLGLCVVALPSAIMASGFIEQIRRRDFVVNSKLVLQVPLFADLQIVHIVEIASMLRPLAVPPLYRIVRAGDAADCMYFVVSGELQVDLGERRVKLSNGDFFGEMGLLNKAPRSADVVAVTDTQLLVLEASDFDKLTRVYPEMRSTIETYAAKRSTLQS